MRTSVWPSFDVGPLFFFVAFFLLVYLYFHYSDLTLWYYKKEENMEKWNRCQHWGVTSEK